MVRRASPRVLGVIAAALGSLCAGLPHAQASGAKAEDFAHGVVIGAGGAFDVELASGSAHHGGNAFIEVVAVENWLELELGISAVTADGGIEVPIDILFKKPFTLARRIEMMIGVGPELVICRNTPKSGEFFGIEFAVDFMFWPSRQVGLWVEPTYDLVNRYGAEHSLGSTGGVIFGW